MCRSKKIITSFIVVVLVALEELGLDLASYIALEDNPKAVHVSLVHHGTKPYYANFGSIKHFHFNSLKDKNLPIDLLISGFYKDLCIKKPMVNQDKERDVCKLILYLCTCKKICIYFILHINITIKLTVLI